VARAVTVIDASVLREVMSRFSEALEAHREEIDSLNVFPVPDGDTGTNMALTQRAVCEALAEAGDMELPEIGRLIGRGALMGARGNSGVILAQVLRGLCDRLCRAGGAGARDLAEALAQASDQARRAVARPVEGTVLTVLSTAAEAAREQGGGDGGPAAVADAALEAARSASKRTRDMLSELRAAGVVDAGGRGMVLLFDALAAAVGGGALTEGAGPQGPVGRKADVEPGTLEQRYEVTYLWEGPSDAIPELSRALNAAGDSVVVVGGDGLFKVHVHTNEAAAVQDVAVRVGSVRDVRVVDLQSEVAEQCVAGQARAVRAAEVLPAGMVAVVEGDGLAELFSSLGASVLPGGPENVPDVDDLVRAIDAVPAVHVLVLPNHRSVRSVAREAAVKSTKDASEVPAVSVPAGLSAAAAFNPVASPEENEHEMSEAAARTPSIEIQRATRDATARADAVEPSAWVVVLNGAVVEAGSDPVELVERRVASFRSPDHDHDYEILMLIVGRDATDGEAERFAAHLRDAVPWLRIEMHRGGQPHSYYLIGLE
jgi:DAK2 domain fusion protein YloV